MRQSKTRGNDGSSLRLTTAEMRAAFKDPIWAEKFPPILDLKLAAEMLRVPEKTVYDWRSRELLDSCSVRPGKRVMFWRDRPIEWAFNGKGQQ